MIEFSVPTRILGGTGVVAARLADEVRALDASPLAVIADRGVAEAGLLAAILAPLSGDELVVCGRISPDPSPADAEQAACAAREAGARAVLAIGGGSALGVGKAVAIRLHNEGDLHDWVGRDLVPVPAAPCIAIPTTAGSGGEVSNTLVLHEPGLERMVAIIARGCEPRLALLDGEMLRSLPRQPMLEAAFDSLSHAFESLWSTGANRISDLLALGAIETIFQTLSAALERDGAAMQALMEASAIANLACGSAGLALVHAFTSSPQVHLPHGYQNAVLLPHVAEFNRPVLTGEARAWIDRLPALYREVAFEPNFHVEDAVADELLAAGRRHYLRTNNRRPASDADLRAILEAAGAPPA
jgi:alcohol dehydrogenase class IV